MELSIKIDGHDIVVDVHNSTDKTIRIWEGWNSWGWNSLNVLIKPENGENVYKIFKDKSRDWTVNYPSFIEIKPGETHTIRLDMSDDSWVIDPAIRNLEKTKVKIKVEYKIDVTDEAKQHNIFMEETQSEWIPSQPPHSWLIGVKK